MTSPWLQDVCSEESCICNYTRAICLNVDGTKQYKVIEDSGKEIDKP